MFLDIILLIFAGGVPYYLMLEKSKKFTNKHIFLISTFFLLCAIVLTSFVSSTSSEILVIISFVNAIFAIYKATKTTNFYKLGYYLVYINAPLFILFIAEGGSLYSLSLLLTLTGVYFIARHYEKYYGSANYHTISGTSLATPYLGTFLTVYLVNLALYPPFPNSFFLFSNMIEAKSTLLSYSVIAVLFFANFILAMRVVAKTVFGKPNKSLHYVEFRVKDKTMHFILLFLLIVLSMIGFQGAIV